MFGRNIKRYPSRPLTRAFRWRDKPASEYRSRGGRASGRYGPELPIDEPPWIIDGAVPYALKPERLSVGGSVFHARSRREANANLWVMGMWCLFGLIFLAFIAAFLWSKPAAPSISELLCLSVMCAGFMGAGVWTWHIWESERRTFYHITVAPGQELAAVVVEDPYGNSLPFDEIPINGGFLRLRCKSRLSNREWCMLVAFGKHCRYLLAGHREAHEFERMMGELPEAFRRIVRPMEDRPEYVVPAWMALW